MLIFGYIPVYQDIKNVMIKEFWIILNISGVSFVYNFENEYICSMNFSY